MSAPKGTKPWNAGTGQGWTDKRGYRWIYVFENGRRRAKREHRHVVESVIGRRLRPDEVVHHKDGNPANNALENLEVQQWGEHTASHSHGSKRTDQTKATQAVIATYREENKRLLGLNAELLDLVEDLLGWYEETCADPKIDSLLAHARAVIAKATQP